MTTATEKLGLLRQAAADAVAAAANLRDRVRDGDTRVTGRQLADADQAIEIANLRVEAGEREATAEQEAERLQALHAAADEYAGAEPAAREAFVAALAGLEQALRAVQATAEDHRQITSAFRRAALAAGDSDRVQQSRATGEIRLDGQRINDVTPAEHVRRIVETAETANRWRPEGRAPWPPVATGTVPDRTRRPLLPSERPPVSAAEAHREEQELIRRWNAEHGPGNQVHVDRLGIIHPGTTGGNPVL